VTGIVLFDLLVLSDVSSITAYLFYTYAANVKIQFGVIFWELDHSSLGAACGTGGGLFQNRWKRTQGGSR